MSSLIKLMELEWRKLKKKTIYGEVLTYIVILLFVPLFFIKNIDAAFGSSYDAVFTLIDLSIRMGYTLYGVSLINQVLIEEYKSKTITLTFGYPNRIRTLFLSKVLLISFMVLVATFVSYILTGVATVIFDHSMDLITGTFGWMELKAYLTKAIIGTFCTVLISLIPMFYFGLIKRATIPAVICGLGLMQVQNFSLLLGYNQVIVLSILCLLGALSIYLTITNAETLGEYK